jgi:hypothetical protein
MREIHQRFWFKISVAGASGLCAGSVLDGATIGLPVFSVAGVLFAAGVLLPYLRRDRFLAYRCIGLVLVSVISLLCAFDVAAMLAGTPPGMPWLMYLAASLVGAAIVLLGARLLIPLKRTLALAITGPAAAITGGFGFAVIGHHSFVLPFTVWHALMALAIYSAENWTVPPHRKT